MAKIQLSNVPRIDEGDLTDSQNIKRIMSYLYVLNEQLRYELTHIDDDNISQEGITTQAISQEALKRAIKDQMGSQTLDLSDNETIRQIQNRIDNMNKVQAQNSANITKVTNELGGKVSKTNFEAFRNQVNALMNGLQSQISNNTTNIGTLQSDYNNHSHSLWSSSSDGSITIGIGNIRQGGTSTTFNIADTQFYKDGVSAAKKKMGVTINTAENTVDVAESATKSAFIASFVELIYNQNNHKYVATGTATANGTTINAATPVTSGTEAYEAGWAAARAKVTTPSAGQGTSFTVGVPDTTVGDGKTLTFTMVKGATPAASGYASVTLGQVGVARISIGEWYTAGWNAACDKISRSGNSIIGPKKNSVGNTETKYTANYKASAYTKETTSNGYYTALVTQSSYSASTHSHDNAYMTVAGQTLSRSGNVNLNNYTGVAVFNAGSDSYKSSSYEAETTSLGSYNYVSKASSYTASSFSWS